MSVGGKLAVVTALAAASEGCVVPSMYVDNTLGDTASSAYHRPQTPKPVQVLYVFKTKGTDNVRATTGTRKNVLATVSDSGLFAAIGPDPVPGGALMSITVENVPEDLNGAAAKGAATGLTLGLVGNVVTDGFVCTIDYIPAVGANKITVTEHHAIHSTVGLHSAPPNSTLAPSIKAANETMMHQIVAAGLKDLSLNPAFGN
jgi:hypothetical protein